MSDLQYEILVYLVIALTVIGAGIYFHSMWIRGGYTGPDETLDLFEVNRVYIHMGGIFIILVFQLMVFSGKEYAAAAWIIVGTILGGIFGVEIFLDGKKVIDKINTRKKKREESE